VSRHVLVLSGPNLAALGSREPEIYGTLTLAELESQVLAEAAALGLEATCRQTDDEAELIGWLHEAASAGWDVVLNPAAFTHTSVAIRDALAAVAVPYIEIHLSNPHAREPFRQHSYFSDKAVGVVCGFGADSYAYALDAALRRLAPAGA